MCVCMCAHGGGCRSILRVLISGVINGREKPQHWQVFSLLSKEPELEISWHMLSHQNLLKRGQQTPLSPFTDLPKSPSLSFLASTYHVFSKGGLDLGWGVSCQKVTEAGVLSTKPSSYLLLREPFATFFYIVIISAPKTTLSYLLLFKCMKNRV